MGHDVDVLNLYQEIPHLQADIHDPNGSNPITTIVK